MTTSSESPGTRSRILIAAATMLSENPTARLSVRAVAARAQVSTGSLRHFFPTQRALIDTVVAGLYDLELPEDPMADRSMPAADRLVACLRLLLSTVGAGEEARRQIGVLYEAYVASPPSEDQAATYLSLERLGRHRIERWLESLIAEGAMPAGQVEQRAQFLSTIVNGLILERALPVVGVGLDAEADTLRLAVQAVMHE